MVDLFTLDHLKTLDAQKLDPAEAETLKTALSATRERAASLFSESYTWSQKARGSRTAL